MSNVFRTMAKQKESAFDETALLRCAAHGCPQRWSVDPSRLCSYHACEPSHRWPEITSALNNTGPWQLGRKYEPHAYPENAGDSKAWARRILARNDTGEKVNPTALQMAKAAAGVA